jgi:hypothetical protein
VKKPGTQQLSLAITPLVGVIVALQNTEGLAGAGIQRRVAHRSPTLDGQHGGGSVSAEFWPDLYAPASCGRHWARVIAALFAALSLPYNSKPKASALEMSSRFNRAGAFIGTDGYSPAEARTRQQTVQ